jgi:hypothetical protein
VTKETAPIRRRRRKKTATWVAGVIGIGTALAPFVVDIIRAFRKQ